MVKWYEHLWPMGGVLTASLLIAWATEVLSFFLSRGLAFALLALLQVLPEFAVEAVITREAALTGDVQYVTANFTGANRLIVGLFIPLVFFMAASRARRQGRRIENIELPLHTSVEVIALILPTLYSFKFVVTGTIALYDAVVLFGMYATYLFIVFKLPPTEEGEHEELPLVPRKIRLQTPGRQKLIVAAFFLLGGFLLFESVHPFYENTLALGAAIGLGGYFLLQWLAPFLSEFPEFITILYWGRTGRAQLGLTNAISSKVNQWTLLIAMIPLVYVYSTWQAGDIEAGIHFSESQRLEVLLTAAQGLFAAGAFMNLRFHRWEAFTLLGLWSLQLLDPLIDPYLPQNLPYFFDPGPGNHPHYIREWTTAAFLLLTLYPMFLSKERFAALRGFKVVVKDHLMQKRQPRIDVAHRPPQE